MRQGDAIADTRGAEALTFNQCIDDRRRLNVIGRFREGPDIMKQALLAGASAKDLDRVWVKNVSKLH